MDPATQNIDHDRQNSKWWTLFAVACGTFMATLDSSIVNIALPVLEKELHCELSQIKWVVLIYLLAITCTLLPVGRVADISNRRNIFRLGFIVFSIGSLLCGFAFTVNFLVFSRLIQGLGAAMLMANGPALITSHFKIHERARALGTLSMVVSLGLVMGPLLGGWIVSHLGWRLIFLINIPIGLAAFFISTKIRTVFTPERGKPFDWLGSILQSLIILCVLFLIDPPILSTTNEWTFILPRWFMGGILLVLFIVFKEIESMIEAPLLDLDLFKIKTFIAGNFSGFFVLMALSGVNLLFPFYLEQNYHLLSKDIGWLMTLIPVSILFSAPIGGWIADHYNQKYGSKWLSMFASFVFFISLFILVHSIKAQNTFQNFEYKMIFSLILIGSAIGLFQAPNNAAVMSSVPLEKLGVASAFLAMFRNLALVTGTGIATKTYLWKLTESQQPSLAIGFSLSLAAIMTLFAIGFSYLKTDKKY
jgi:EmrB/QacA subfamily drug resistance transporter